MLKRYVILISLFALSYSAQAQGNGPGIRGARAAALGNASVALADGWAMGNNVAGLGQLTEAFGGVYAENRFLIRALSNAVLTAALPLGRLPNSGKARNGVVGVEVQRFGDKLYSEQRIGTGYGYKGGLFSLGARVDVLQVSIEGLGSRRAVAASLGGQAEVVPRRLFFGAYIYNINQAKLARYDDERVPTVLKAGLSYQPAEKVRLNVETEKDVDQAADFKAGLEYQAVEALAVRAGFTSLSQQTSGGVGLRAGVFRLDYAAVWQSRLGLSQHLSVSLQRPKAQ
ncbi:hypothetical protein SAMN02745146_2295 [Hymenobacter daecheongensis DSM 21074]|uniref:PorV/PorQ family protein n=1 Tax=Hymenobacter daecheongensis DSM 21074 TaxID=1121955 RepID=A0A1M6GKG8_9BACT|nr:hypothetical protein [Hymenobacter daecheongensis]SHJ10429.1 hypothetical protein SAMN02745146_2295 [Hymenobacter daecheongensis DSM 21074]